MPFHILHPTPTYDLVVIGSGPNALSLVSRLYASAPDTSSESTLYRLPKTKSSHKPPSILVIDPSGKWMHNWNCHFSFLDIPHLRSLVQDHPDPSDRDSLLAYAYNNPTVGSLKRLDTLFDRVKKNRSQVQQQRKGKREYRTLIVNERNRQWFQLPSSRLFSGFCDDVVDRYKLDKLVVKGYVEDLELNDGMIRVKYNDSVVNAKHVVSCIGFCNQRKIPVWAQEYMIERDESCKLYSAIAHSEDICASDSRYSFNHVKHKTVFVIGGGLTSGHLALLALKHGAANVKMLFRDRLKVKQFDVDAEFVNKRYGNLHLAEFYAESDYEQREQFVKRLRGGGSMTPEMMEKLKLWVDKELLEWMPKTEIEQIDWINDRWKVVMNGGRVECCDVILLGTGCTVNIGGEALFSRIMQHYPIQIVEGYPAINSSCKWNDSVPLYLMGAYAALQLGPLAQNLNGAWHGSRRIYDDLFPRLYDAGETIGPHMTNRNIYDVLTQE